MPPGLFANSNVIDMRAQTLKVLSIRIFLHVGDLFPPFQSQSFFGSALLFCIKVLAPPPPLHHRNHKALLERLLHGTPVKMGRKYLPP